MDIGAIDTECGKGWVELCKDTKGGKLGKEYKGGKGKPGEGKDCMGGKDGGKDGKKGAKQGKAKAKDKTTFQN